jgi:hypothetical protein
LRREFFAAASIAAFSSWFQTAPALRKAEMSAVLQPGSAQVMRRQRGKLTAGAIVLSAACAKLVVDETRY